MSSNEHIPDAVLADLPDDPEFAFVELDGRMRKIIKESQRQLHYLETSIVEDYHAYLDSFRETHKLDVDIPIDTGNEAILIFEDITSSVDRFKKKVRRRQIHESVIAVSSLVEFSTDERNEIHGHLENVRSLIHTSNLPTRKKNILQKKLAALSEEVDKIGTRTDALLGLYLDATLALGQGATNAKPFMEEVKSILKIVFRAKAREEGVALPPPSEVSLLEEQPAQAEDVSQSQEHSDDVGDSPFPRRDSFSPQFLDDIRDRVPLSDTIGRRIRLVRRGREHVSLCPFHNEKTPSFTVNEDKGFFHCFGCGAHGDVIGFEMRIDNIGFVEAVERLARTAGLQLPAAINEDEILPNTR